MLSFYFIDNEVFYWVFVDYIEVFCELLMYIKDMLN